MAIAITKKQQSEERVSSSRKKIEVRDKAEKSRDIVFVRCFVALEAPKVGSLKVRVRRQLVR